MYNHGYSTDIDTVTGNKHENKVIKAALVNTDRFQYKKPS